MRSNCLVLVALGCLTAWGFSPDDDRAKRIADVTAQYNKDIAEKEAQVRAFRPQVSATAPCAVETRAEQIRYARTMADLDIAYAKRLLAYNIDMINGQTTTEAQKKLEPDMHQHEADVIRENERHHKRINELQAGNCVLTGGVGINSANPPDTNTSPQPPKDDPPGFSGIPLEPRIDPAGNTRQRGGIGHNGGSDTALPPVSGPNGPHSGGTSEQGDTVDIDWSPWWQKTRTEIGKRFYAQDNKFRAGLSCTVTYTVSSDGTVRVQQLASSGYSDFDTYVRGIFTAISHDPIMQFPTGRGRTGTRLVPKNNRPAHGNAVPARGSNGRHENGTDQGSGAPDAAQRHVDELRVHVLGKAQGQKTREDADARLISWRLLLCGRVGTGCQGPNKRTGTVEGLIGASLLTMAVLFVIPVCQAQKAEPKDLEGESKLPMVRACSLPGALATA